MIALTEIIATCIAATVTGIGASYLTFRLTSAHAAGRDSERWLAIERRLQILERSEEEGAVVREQNAVRLEGIKGNLEYLLNTVGIDGKHGLRGDLHSLRGEWSPILIRLQALMEDERGPRMRRND